MMQSIVKVCVGWNKPKIGLCAIGDTRVKQTFMLPKPIELITLDDIEARIYPVKQGYRVEVYSTLSDYWHPGIFGDFQQLEEWLKAELEKLNDGFPLGGDWMMLEGDFDGNGVYRDWFICQAQDWQGYDPLTNHCHTAPSLKHLKEKIDRIKDERLDVL